MAQPFQGIKPNTDALDLALRVREMRLLEEQMREEMRLKKMQTLADIESTREQARRDGIIFDLDRRKKEDEFGDAASDQEMGMGSVLEAVNNPALAAVEREAAGRAFDFFVRNQASLGRDPSMIGANIGAGLGLVRQGEMKEEGVKENDAARDERAAIASDARAERMAIRREAREAAAEKLADQAEENALAAGKWTGVAIDKKRESEERRLGFAPEVSRMWDRVGKLNPTRTNDIYEMTYMAQKAIDDGGVVRTEDVNAWRAQGFSGFEAALASAQGFYDKNKKYPPGFGEALRETMTGILESQDSKTVSYADEFDDYADQNGWSPAMKKRAEAFRLEKKRARERLSRRSAPASGGGGIPGGSDPRFPRIEK